MEFSDFKSNELNLRSRLGNRRTNFSNVGCDDGDFGKEVEDVIEPSREKGSTGLCEVKTRHGSQFDAESLEKDGE